MAVWAASTATDGGESELRSASAARAEARAEARGGMAVVVAAGSEELTLEVGWMAVASVATVATRVTRVVAASAVERVAAVGRAVASTAGAEALGACPKGSWEGRVALAAAARVAVRAENRISPGHPSCSTASQYRS